MKRYDMIFLDRDGTLNPDPGYISRLEHFKFYDFTLRAIKLLAEAGGRFTIITNQSGVSRGLIQIDELEKIHGFIRKSFAESDLTLTGIYVCTDHPDSATDFRKPGPGMFLQAAAEHDLELGNCLMVGDSVSDIEAGLNLGMETMLVLTGDGQGTLEKLGDNRRPDYVVPDLLSGARLLTGSN